MEQRVYQNVKKLSKNYFWGIFLTWPPVSSFWPFKRVKRLQNASKTLIFKNWLDTCHKKETYEPKLYPTILGGVSRGFWSLFLDWGTRRAVFWHLKTGSFAQNANIKPIFKNRIFSTVLEPFYPLKRPKTKKWMYSLNFHRNCPIFWEKSYIL